ncbi:MAG: carboxypeptidase-like regulatory domain-containing protein [Lentisphaerales bacterium]|nr:carboxypeptidase-like regulatory domain-containing protein [Lentisphaerales bacterium]
MKLVTLLLICLISASCITEIKSSEPIDHGNLSNKVYRGQAALKGNIKTVERHMKLITKITKVLLVPVCPASTDIITQIYNNTEASSRDIKNHPRIDWQDLQEFVRTTKTNEKGNFMFASISPGDYYLLSYIKMRDKLSVKGGSVMRKVEVKNGRMKEISVRL